MVLAPTRTGTVLVAWVIVALIITLNAALVVLLLRG
jgi:hypothetical protein